MRHPHQIVLQSYVDSELGDSLCAQVEAHIARCPECLEAIESMDSLGQRLRQSKPFSSAFCCEQDFMGRLGATIRRHRASPWTLLAYLPPLLLLAIATAIQFGMVITLSIMSLEKLHMLPSSTALLEKPVDKMFRTPLIDMVVAQGWLDTSSGQRMLVWWEQQGNQGHLSLAALIISMFLISTLFLLGLLWFCCWHRSRSAHDQGGQ